MGTAMQSQQNGALYLGWGWCRNDLTVWVGGSDHSDLVADVGARKKLRRVLLLHVQGPGDVAHQVFEICERARVCQLRQRYGIDLVAPS